MSQRPEPWHFDPADPRAPSQEQWDLMSAAERERVIESLPSEFPLNEAAPPEGDRHFNAKVNARRTLGRFFERMGRRVYLACELPVYYQGEPTFAPDVMAVTDVECHERERWVVSAEGKGLDFALEVHVSGRRRKDNEQNVVRYARLGITEYFIFDRGRSRLSGFRLGSPVSRRYEPIVPQHGHYASSVLGLELGLEGERLRFYVGDAPVPDSDELIAKLDGMVNQLELKLAEAEQKAEEESRLREEESQLREEESRLREDVERRLAEAIAEIARLKGARGDG